MRDGKRRRRRRRHLGPPAEVEAMLAEEEESARRPRGAGRDAREPRAGTAAATAEAATMRRAAVARRRTTTMTARRRRRRRCRAAPASRTPKRGRAGGRGGPRLFRLPGQYLPVADGGGGDAPPGRGRGARRTEISIDSAGTGDWHVGEHARSAQPRRGRRRAASRCRGRRSSSRRATSRATITSSRWTGRTATSCDAWRRTPPSATRSGCCVRTTPSAPPDADVPDPYYGGPRGFEEVFDICERACKGMLAALRARGRREGALS